MNHSPKTLLTAVAVLALSGTCHAQFLDSFDGPQIEGWEHFTGDGTAAMDFVAENGTARISVDATNDEHNVWWAIIKRDVTSSLDLEKLKEPGYELRVEARVRGSHAPRRVNFMINTQRTTNFHKDLREFDLPDSTDWHTISMTTEDFDVVPGDTVFVQFCVTDWGPDQYHVDLDYYRADVVHVDSAGPDKGEPLIYHPAAADPATFSHRIEVAHDSLINSDFSAVNFNDWHVEDSDGTVHLLTVDGNQWAVLRWDFAASAAAKADGPGMLELTTYSVPKGGRYIEHYGEDLGVEFGKVRVIEILGGDPDWNQDAVTWNNLLQGGSVAEVFNTQMIFDTDVSENRGGKTYVTLSRPVMQRLLDGKTKGLLIRPLGAIVASFYASEESIEGRAPKLYFNTAK